MLKEHRRALDLLFRTVDILLIVLSAVFAFLYRFEGLSWGNLNIGVQFQTFLIAFILSWIFLSSRYKLYASKRYFSINREIVDLLIIIGISCTIAMIPSFFIRQYPISRLFLLYFVGTLSLSLITFRLVLRWTLNFIRLRGYNYRVALIIGRNCRAEVIASRILNSPQFGVKLLGFLDCTKYYKNVNQQYQHDVIGDLDKLESILREYVVDEVFVTLPIKSFYSEIETILQICEQMGVEVKIPIDLFNRNSAKSNITIYQDVEVIDFYTTPDIGWQIIVKRIFDFTLSLILLILLLPLMIIVSLAIKIKCPGPIFFIQKRMGYNGRTFNCYKFRTMIVNADELKEDLCGLNEMSGPVFKIKDDPRVTAIGRFLRKTSIDELPQLFNVLKGDMSLVGPRPPVPEEVCQYQLSDRRRLSIKPGITCTWQVSGRNKVSFEEWMKLDQKYIDEWSLMLDIKILLKTIPAVLLQKGAQ